MLLKKWENIPQTLKNEITLEYYGILKRKSLYLIFKRLFDIIVSCLLIVLLSPIYIFIGLWIKIDSVGPMLYKQNRISQYRKEFKILKFRTMVVDADKSGPLITTNEDSRITKVGNKIRQYRLDELPQLFNVLLGQMSFVGARPEVSYYVDKYNNEMLSTLLLPAGITSLASIKYRNEDELVEFYLHKGLSIDDIYTNYILPEKMKWNVEYLKEANLYNDIKLCFLTVFQVFK